MSILSTIGYKSHTNYSFFKKVDSIINCLSNRVLLKPDPFAFQLLALRFLHVLASKVPRLAIFFIISALFLLRMSPHVCTWCLCAKGAIFRQKTAINADKKAPPLVPLLMLLLLLQLCLYCNNVVYY